MSNGRWVFSDSLLRVFVRKHDVGKYLKIIELVGTSEESWEDAARTAIETSCKSLVDLRVAEVVKMDAVVSNKGVKQYRVRLKVSFKYERSIFVRSKGLPPGLYPYMRH